MGVLGRSHDERSGCGLHDKAPYAAAPLMTCRLDLTAGIFKARKVFVGRVWTSGRYLPSLPQFCCAELWCVNLFFLFVRVLSSTAGVFD